MSDWWARKLGGDAPPAQQQPSTPPVQQPGWHPQPAGPPPANWSGAGGSGAAPIQQQNFIPKEEQALDEAEFFAALHGQLAVETRGDEAALDVAKGNIDAYCPSCKSPNYFSRMYAENGMPLRGPAPAPHCSDCGYPMVQAGSGKGSLAKAKAGGPAHQARSPIYNPDYKPRTS